MRRRIDSNIIYTFTMPILLSSICCVAGVIESIEQEGNAGQTGRAIAERGAQYYCVDSSLYHSAWIVLFCFLVQ